MSNPKRVLVLAMALLAVLALGGCGDDGDDNPIAPPPQQAHVMVVHASPDAPAVDLLIDNVVVAPGLSYPNNTSYLGVAAGNRNVKVNLAGTAITVVDTDVNVVAGVSSSLFAAGPAASVEGVLTLDDLTAPPTGKARVRFVHLSSDAPSIDLAVEGGGAVLFPDQAYKESSSFVAMNAGTYNLEFRQAGTSTVLLSVFDVMLQSGKIYTLTARGFVGGTGSQALALGIISNN